MKASSLFFVCFLLLTGLAGQAFAQELFFCVKPGGTPVCAIEVMAGTNADPSVLCNKASPQCALACVAEGGAGAAAKYGAMGLPVIPVDRTMATPENMMSQPETPEMCKSQYQACVRKCQTDPMNAQNPAYLQQCYSACQSVYSGCGTGNREIQ